MNEHLARDTLHEVRLLEFANTSTWCIAVDTMGEHLAVHSRPASSVLFCLCLRRVSQSSSHP